jgi:hypothetical protein
MTAIIKNNFRLQNAKEFLKSVDSDESNYYLFIGKSLPWGTLNSELSPSIALDTMDEERRIWDEMLGLKKISTLDSSLVIRRSDWKANTIYAIFDDKNKDLLNEPTQEKIEFAANQGQNIFAGNFYVLTDNYDIFVCLENNNNSISQIKPERSGTSNDLLKLDDGYVWKYMTTIKTSDAIKFLTDSWIPVKTLLQPDDSAQFQVQESSVPGSILSVVIESAGQNYVQLTGLQLSSVVNNQPQVGQSTAIISNTDTNNIGVLINSRLHINSNISTKILNVQDNNGILTVILDSIIPEEGILSNNVTLLPDILIESNTESNFPVKMKPVLNNGQLSKIDILSNGKNISFIKLKVIQNTNQTANIRAVISPVKGLGKDIEKDLGAIFVMLNAKLEYNTNDSDFPLTNDYRQIGIIKNVLSSDETLATTNSLDATKKITIQNMSDQFMVDSIISQGDIKAIIVEIISNEDGSKTISYVQTPETGYGNFVLTNDDQSLRVIDDNDASGNVISININTEIKKFHGEMLYIENRRPILRAQDQIEDIKAIVEF